VAPEEAISVVEPAVVLAAAGGFVITRVWAALLALGGLVSLAVVAHLVVLAGAAHERSASGPARDPAAVPATEQPETASMRPAARRRRGIKSLVIGTDGRASTSKVQVVLWTFAVFYAFLFRLLWGRSTACDPARGQAAPLCQDAADARGAFSRAVNGELQIEYYVLLGFPMAAAVAAKAITTAKVDDVPTAKPEIGADQKGVVQGVAEIVSNDAGQTDLLDFQYFAFNLLTLGFFFVEFLTKPGDGLPDLPPTLIALAGASTAVYTAKKALERPPGVQKDAQQAPQGAQ
jgi:hypothetical protein